MNDTARLLLSTLETGLPVLLLHFVATLSLLGIGVALYMAITPFHERRLVGEGNIAAGIVMAGTVVALAIPLAATLATSFAVLDILLWGAVALFLQLIAFGVATLMLGGLRERIEAGNTAAATALIGVQIAFALLNAGAMAG